MSLESFKSFVRGKPNLVKFVNNKETSWQELYNMFELYGPENSVWNKYLGITNSSPISFKDIFSSFKNMNMDEVQKGITSLQKGIGYIEELVSSKTNVSTRNTNYEPRQVYKRLDD